MGAREGETETTSPLHHVGGRRLAALLRHASATVGLGVHTPLCGGVRTDTRKARKGRAASKRRSGGHASVLGAKEERAVECKPQQI